MNPNDYNWKEAFGFAEDFSIDDVETVLLESEGQNDGDSWLSFGRLKDGRYYFLTAWCDYTGWDCRSGGDSYTSLNKDEVINLGMSDRERDRLALPHPPVPEHVPISDID